VAAIQQTANDPTPRGSGTTDYQGVRQCLPLVLSGSMFYLGTPPDGRSFCAELGQPSRADDNHYLSHSMPNIVCRQANTLTQQNASVASRAGAHAARGQARSLSWPGHRCGDQQPAAQQRDIGQTVGTALPVLQDGPVTQAGSARSPGQTDTARNGPRGVAPCTTMVSRSPVQVVGRPPSTSTSAPKRVRDLRGLGPLTCETAYLYVCQLASPGIRGVPGA
jgi:hypothetical protein